MLATRRRRPADGNTREESSRTGQETMYYVNSKKDKKVKISRGTKGRETVQEIHQGKESSENPKADPFEENSQQQARRIGGFEKVDSLRPKTSEEQKRSHVLTERAAQRIEVTTRPRGGNQAGGSEYSKKRRCRGGRW